MKFFCLSFTIFLRLQIYESIVTIFRQSASYVFVLPSDDLIGFVFFSCHKPSKEPLHCSFATHYNPDYVMSFLKLPSSEILADLCELFNHN